MAVADEQILQDLAATDRLRTAQGIERHVMASLQPVLHVPVREAMANVIDDGKARHELIRVPQPAHPPGHCGHASLLRDTRHPLRWSSLSFLADVDVGRVRMFHSDNVVSGINVVNLAGDATR